MSVMFIRNLLVQLPVVNCHLRVYQTWLDFQAQVSLPQGGIQPFKVKCAAGTDVTTLSTWILERVLQKVTMGDWAQCY